MFLMIKAMGQNDYPCGTMRIAKPSVENNYVSFLGNIEATPPCKKAVVKIFIHILRDFNGTDGMNVHGAIQLANLANKVVNDLNSYYNTTNKLSFVLKGAGIDEINISNFYGFTDPSQFDDLDNDGKFDQLHPNQSNNAIDIYFLYNAQMGFSIAAGIGASALVISEAHALSVTQYNDSYKSYALVHEMGHCLELFHTFHGAYLSNSNTGYYCSRSENGIPEKSSEPLTTGDYVEDTKPDPTDNINQVDYSTCQNAGQITDCFGSTVDESGVLYDPLPDNVMDYLNQDQTNCPYKITVKQIERCLAALTYNRLLFNVTDKTAGVFSIVTTGNLQQCSNNLTSVDFNLTADPAYYLKWTNGSDVNNITVNPTQTTTYTVTGTSACMQPSTASVTVHVDDDVTFNIIGNEGVCVGSTNNNYLVVNVINGNTNYTNGTWSIVGGGVGTISNTGVLTTPVGTTATSTTIRYQATTNNLGCTPTVEKVVYIVPYSSTIGIVASKTNVCDGIEDVTLTATGTLGLSYTWNTGQTTNAITVRPTIAQHSYTIVGGNPCGAAYNVTANINIIANPIPVINITPFTSQVCMNNSYSIPYSVLPTSSSWQYTWETTCPTATAISAYFTPTTAGICSIKLTAIDPATTCTSNKSITVEVLPDNVQITKSKIALCEGSHTQFEANTYLATWESSDSKIVSINPTTGYVEAYTVGSVTITCKALLCGVWHTDTRTVTVSPIPKLSQYYNVLKTCVSSYTFTVANDPNGGTWESKDPTIASILNATTGQITPVAAGTTEISYWPNVIGCLADPIRVPITVIRCTTTPCSTVTAIPIAAGTLSGGAFSNGLFEIMGDITIDGSVNFANAQVKIANNATITVVNNGFLYISGSHFYGCNGMWKGIKVMGDNAFINVDAGFIEDAEIAILYKPDNPLPYYANMYAKYIRAVNTIFNKNDISIQIEDVKDDYYSSTLPFTIYNCIFTCRAIDFDPNSIASWNNIAAMRLSPSTPFTNYGSTPAVYSSPYINNADYPDNTPAAYLQNGIANSKPFAAIVLKNVGSTDINNTVNNTLKTCVIGNKGIRNGAGILDYNTNIFDNLQFGIYAENATVQINNCTFQKPATNGAGIYVNNNLSTSGVTINTDVGMPNNAFFNMKTAINISGGQWATVENCDIRSNQSYNDIDSWAELDGKRGIVVNNHNFEQISVTNNNIYNIKYPIKVFCARDKTHIYDPISVGAINVNKNKINAVLAGASNGSGQEYVQNAIDLSSLYIYNNNNEPLNCNENEIINVLNGIRLSNWKRTNTIVQKNTVTLAQHPTNATYISEGITLEGGFGSSLDYDDNNLPLGSNTDNIVYDNTVTGTGTTGFSVGIKLAQQSNTNVGCNTVSNAHDGFMFDGTNLLTKFFDNIIGTDNNYGVTLTNDGSIGKQGNEKLPVNINDPDVCTSNNSFTDAVGVNGSWNSANGQYMIYCNQSLPSKSIFVLRNGYPELDLGASSYSENILDPTTLYSSTNGTLYTNNPDGTNCERCVGYTYYPRKRNKTLLEEIADGTVLLPNDDADDRLMAMQQQLYELIKAKPELTANTNSLQQFIYDNQWTSLDFIHYAGRYVAKGEMETVKTLLGFWPGQEKLDDNYYRYFDWLVKMYDNPNWMPTESEVFEMANKCPIKDGLIVYAARNLYNSMIKEIYKFDNSCDGNNAARGVKQATQFIRLKQPKLETTIKQAITDISVYPNPATSVVNITSNKSNIRQIEIIDMLGKSVWVKKNGNTNNIQVDIKGFQKGLFLVKLTTDKNAVVTNKLIIE